MRDAAQEARGKLRGAQRPTRYATDQEEWAAVDRMALASTAVYQQNVELRLRLAAATQRASGCDAEELQRVAAAPAALRSRRRAAASR